MFPLIVTVIIVLIFSDKLPPSQEIHHWIVLVGIRIIVAKFDINDGVILSIP